jgi:hypothetical protein
VPLPIPRHLHRIDRIHPVPRHDHGLHPWPPIGLDPDHHLRRIIRSISLGPIAEAISDQGVQLGYPLDSLRQPTPGTSPTLLIDDLDVVVALRPVVPDEDHRPVLLSPRNRANRRRPAAT